MKSLDKSQKFLDWKVSILKISTEEKKNIVLTIRIILTSFKSWSQQIKKSWSRSQSRLVSTVETPRLLVLPLEKQIKLRIEKPALTEEWITFTLADVLPDSFGTHSEKLNKSVFSKSVLFDLGFRSVIWFCTVLVVSNCFLTSLISLSNNWSEYQKA